MKNIKCQIPNHQEKEISSVCLNKDCKDKRLCCLNCIGKIHSGHLNNIIEIQQLNDFIQKERIRVKFPQSYSYGQLQIVKALQQMSNLTYGLQSVIEEKLELVKQQNLNEFLKQSSNLQQGIKYWNTLIEGILKYVKVDNQQIILMQQNEGQLSEIEGKQIGIIRKSEQSIQEIIQSLNLFGQLSFSKKPIELVGHLDQVNQVTISQDGSLIASGSCDKTVIVWDVKTKRLLQTIQNDSDVYRIAISSKNEYLAYGDENKFIKLFDLKLNKLLWIQKAHTKNINCIIFSQDTQYLLSGGDDKKIIIRNLFQNKIINCFETNSLIVTVILSRDIKFVSCMCWNEGTIYIFDLQTKTKLIQMKDTHSYGYGLCVSSDSSIYISSGHDGIIKIWKLNELQNNQRSLTLSKSIKAANKSIDQVLLTSDDLYIISICNREGQIMIHEQRKGKLIQALDSETKSYNQAFISISNNMNTLVSSNSRDKNFRMWTSE